MAFQGGATGIPTTGGVPDLSGTLIPENFASEYLRVLYFSLVFFSIANTQFQGDLMPGGLVHIRSVPEISQYDETDMPKGGSLAYDELSSTNTDLKIDKKALWRFRVHKSDTMLADQNFSDATARTAGLRQKEAIERRVFAAIPSDAHADNIGVAAGAVSESYDMGASGSPVQFKPSTAIKILTEMAAVLREQNTPNEPGSIFAILPPALIAKMQQSDLKAANIMGDDTSILRNRMMGYVGNIAGLDIYESNQLSSAVDASNSAVAYNCLFGHKYCLGFAGKPTEEAFQLTDPDQAANLIRSEFIYGWKIIKPQVLGVLYAQPAND